MDTQWNGMVNQLEISVYDRRIPRMKEWKSLENLSAPWLEHLWAHSLIDRPLRPSIVPLCLSSWISLDTSWVYRMSSIQSRVRYICRWSTIVFNSLPCSNISFNSIPHSPFSFPISVWVQLCRHNPLLSSLSNLLTLNSIDQIQYKSSAFSREYPIHQNILLF